METVGQREASWLSKWGVQWQNEGWWEIQWPRFFGVWCQTLWTREWVEARVDLRLLPGLCCHSLTESWALWGGLVELNSVLTTSSLTHRQDILSGFKNRQGNYQLQVSVGFVILDQPTWHWCMASGSRASRKWNHQKHCDSGVNTFKADLEWQEDWVMGALGLKRVSCLNSWGYWVKKIRQAQLVSCWLLWLTFK